MKLGLSFMILLLTLSCGQQKAKDYYSNDELKPNEPKTSGEESAPIGTGKITSIADGFDVRRVNLFSSTSPDRAINCFLTNGAMVNILKDEDPYYLVESVANTACKGYCMKGFVIND